jgi:enoyl-CoA hydratase
VRVGRGSPWSSPLIHMIPQRIYMEIVLTGKPISAQRAYEIGLINRITEPGAVLDAAFALAKEVLSGAPLSVAAARETVMLATEMSRAAALDAAYAAHEHAYNSEDAQEGPRAFAEKRRPMWKGR